MDRKTKTVACREKIQADITDMEWAWRRLDELDRHGASAAQIALAKQEKEAEVERLRAELAEASPAEDEAATRTPAR